MSSPNGTSISENAGAMGVELCEINDCYGHVIIVRDVECRHYLIRLVPYRDDQRIGISIATEWSDKQPGELANFTPRYEDQAAEFITGEITVSDEGLLRAWQRESTASHIVMHRGWAIQLPLPFVDPLRRAIAMAEAAISPLAGIRPPSLRQATDDEVAGMRWWNGLPVAERAHWLSEAGSAVVADAWAAYQRVHR